MLLRVLITGSRDWKDKEAIENAIIDLHNWGPIDWDDVVVVHGDCPTGADAIAQEFCEQTGIVTERHPADWSIGKKAGPLRNQEMVDLGAYVCLAFLLPSSRGTVDCIKRAKAAGIPVIEYNG